jgi:AcrR family transcriptional regulator
MPAKSRPPGKPRTAASPRAAAKTRPRAGAAKASSSAVRARPAQRAPARDAGLRARSKDATKRRIVAAALKLFESRGFESTTTKEIAKKARVAEGTVFNHFETKEDIALHFFELEVDHAIAAVRADARLESAPLEERLFALVVHQIEYLAPYERFIGAAFVQALRPTSKLTFSTQASALRTRYLRFVQEQMDAAMPGQSFEMTWMAPQAFWIFYIGVLLYWLSDTSPGKANTLAFLDRSLAIGATVLRRVRGE